MDASIEKVSIIVSKGSLEGIYPALIMANGARAEGIEANLFFTFFGLDAVSKKRHEHIKMATVGNPGLHLATLAGALPGMPRLMTGYLERKMGKLDIPPIPEFIEMIADTGAACTAARHPATCSGSARTIWWSRSRTSSPSATSTLSPPAARSSSPDRSRACT
jgi:peroxiredoxin family protein